LGPTAVEHLNARGRALRRPPAALLLAAFAAAALIAIPAGAGGGTAAKPVFTFGRTGGNIAPFAVVIRSDGTVGRSGPVRLARPHVRISKTRRAALLAYARSQSFWSLRTMTICPKTLPDFASLYVTIRTSTRTRRVVVRGSCSKRFSRIYDALAAAATVRS
jgi:hypothetical protein